MAKSASIRLGFLIRSKRDELGIRLSDMHRSMVRHGADVPEEIISAIEDGTIAPNRQTIKAMAIVLSLDEQEMVRMAQDWNRERRKNVKTVIQVVRAKEIVSDYKGKGE